MGGGLGVLSALKCRLVFNTIIVPVLYHTLSLVASIPKFSDLRLSVGPFLLLICFLIRDPHSKHHSQSCEAGADVAERMLNQGGHFYVCGSARQVPEDIYTAMKEVSWQHHLFYGEEAQQNQKCTRCLVRQVMMAHERCPEEDAEAILSNLKMEGRRSARNGGRKPPRKTYDSIESSGTGPEVQAPGRQVTRRRNRDTECSHA